jgi:hypothetical protein
LFKKGGVLKFQYGGMSGATTKGGEYTSTKNKTVKDYRAKDATLADYRNNNDLTDADLTELTSIAMDLLGTITSLTGASALGAGLGVGATGAQFIADFKRDGLD